MSDNKGTTIGTIADSVTSNTSDVAKLVTSASYVAGLGFSAASVLKFKAHKDNPTQLPVGTAADLVAKASDASLSSLEKQAESAGVTASEVEAAASKAGITQAGVEAKVTAAGATSAQISAAESAAKKLFK